MKNKVEKNISLRFLGACGTVTGSKYYIKNFEKKLLVDCGLFQGLKYLRKLNRERFQVNPAGIDHVLLTHGHLDHVGYLPRLVKEGFRGSIIGTSPTLQIARIILEDSAKIQEEEAERANREGYSKHRKAEPLYTLDDVAQTIPLFEPANTEGWNLLGQSMTARFRYNGHIIGSSFIELMVEGKRFVFSGDVGRKNDPLLFPPEKPEEADVLFIESTYGNRLHATNPEEQLASVIKRAFDNKSLIIIPSFAVERTQSLMYLLWQMRKKGLIPPIPVYMDSPMGRNVLEIFHHNPQWHKLSPDACTEMCRDIHRTKTMQETYEIMADPHPKIVVAGSGMAQGGRVLAYFERFLGDPNATILLVGYQAEGTRGRQLLEGAPEIKLYGNYFPVKAKVENITGLSAHADRDELLDWLSALRGKPEKVFIVHGEPASADAFRVKLRDTFGWKAEIPRLFSHVKI